MSALDSHFVLLREAPERFGPKNLIAKARREAQHRAKAPGPKETGNAATDLSIQAQYLVSLLRPPEAVIALRAYVANMLHEGLLDAEGIQVEPEPGSAPEWLPRHMFSDPNKINWDHSRIKKSGRKYEEIRVRRGAPQPSPISRPEPSIARRNGRPSKDSEIMEAIDALTAANIKLNNMPRKEACDLIRAEAKRLGHNIDIGYSDPVIKRALQRKFGIRK